jgi:hypothetical protein
LGRPVDPHRRICAGGLGLALGATVLNAVIFLALLSSDAAHATYRGPDERQQKSGREAALMR